MRLRAAACLIVAASIISTIVPAAAQQKAAPAATSEAAFLAANAKKPGVTQTASGLQYQVIAGGTGASPTDDDIVLVNYTGELADGTIFDQSPQPMPMPVAGVVPGFSEALKLMGKGAKYRIWIPAALGYGNQAMGPIPANATLVFDIELLDFLPRATIEEYQRQMSGGADAGAPPAPIPVAEATFLTKNRAVPGVTETASGLQYRVLTPATGPHPTDSDVVLVNYEARFVDGRTFDKSEQLTSLPVAGVVPGFAEALKLMSKGEKIRVWMPSPLAYGAKDQRDQQGKVVIPANSLTVFDIELHDYMPQSVVDDCLRKMAGGGYLSVPVPTGRQIVDISTCWKPND